MRVAVGQVASGKYGIMGFDASGNEIFELSEDTNQIAGFTIDGHSMRSTGIEINNATQDLFISSSKFKTTHAGAITASNMLLEGTARAVSFAEKLVVVTDSNKTQYFANDNNYSFKFK